MPYSIYDGVIVPSQLLLTSLSAILKKAEEHPDGASFPSTRLAPDMLPFSYQIFAVCQISEVQVLKIRKQELPKAGQGYKDELKTYPEMHARIKLVKELLDGVTREEAEASTDEKQDVDFGKMGIKTPTTAEFCMGTGVPNVYFHVCMAYAILRGKGVELGKLDYLAPFFMGYLG